MLNLDDYRWLGECRPHHGCPEHPIRLGKNRMLHHSDCIAAEIQPLIEELDRVYWLWRNADSKSKDGALLTWRCEVCGNPATYLQIPRIRAGRGWHSVCRRHDPSPDGSGYYFIEVDRARTLEQVDDWYRHLRDKRWFDRHAWDDFIDNYYT